MVERRGVEAASGLRESDHCIARRLVIAPGEHVLERPPRAQVLGDEYSRRRVAGEEPRAERWRGAGPGQKLQARPVVEATIALGLEVLDDDRCGQALRPGDDAAAPDVVTGPRLQGLRIGQAGATERASGGRQHLLTQRRRTTRLAF